MVSTFNKSALSQMCKNHRRAQNTKVCKTASTIWITVSENLCKSSPLSTDRRVKGIQPFELLVQNPDPSSRFPQSVVWSIHEALNAYGMNKWTNEQVGVQNTTNKISLPRGFCRARPGLIIKYRKFAPRLLNSLPRILPQMNIFFLCFASNISSYI